MQALPATRTLPAVAAVLLALATIEGAAADLTLRADLRRAAQQRVFFAHQSVGRNVLEGMERLAARENVAVQIDDIAVPENGNPLLKLRNFERAFAERNGAYDVALVKFCYVDIGADTNAAALFDQYRETIERMQARYPRTTFVHVTVPLTTEQRGFKALAKRLLGRHPSGTVENLRREEYNALLRRAYLGKEPVFDLARVESIMPDGTPAQVVWEGRKAPALAAAYTSDGGHLNAEGRLRAARELAAVLSATLSSSRRLSAAAAR